jgi:hypothetical protein
MSTEPLPSKLSILDPIRAYRRWRRRSELEGEQLVD